jgi:hypothetical protein
MDGKVTWTREDEEKRIKEEKAYNKAHLIPMER